jgi:NTE family protein
MTTKPREEGAPRPSRRASGGRGRGRRPHDGRERVAFVLSGGGNLGAMQVGMLRALLEHGVRPDLLLGCSVGAINGAGFADDPTAEGVAHMEKVWRELVGQNLLPSGWLPNAVALARRGEAIHGHDGLKSMAEDSLRSETFEDLQVPFQCVATDMAAVREVWFSSGPLVPAILASAALPAVYPAVEVDGVRYLDGGIVDDVPVSRAVEMGATVIYVLQVGSFTRPRPEPRRPLDVAIHSYWVARHYRFKRDLAAMPADVEVHLLPAGETPKMRFNDFTQTGTLIDMAYEASSAYLDDRDAGQPVPTIAEALSQVESAYEAPVALEDVVTHHEPVTEQVDSRWRRTVAAARRRDRERDADGGTTESGAPADDELAGIDGVQAALEASRWRRAVGIARRERQPAGSEPTSPAGIDTDTRTGTDAGPGAGDDGDEIEAPGQPLAGTSGLSAAHAVGARVAKILSRGEHQ